MIDTEKTITRVRRMLGEPIVSVELTDEQMTSLLKDAQETFYLYATLAGTPMEVQDNIEYDWIKKYFYALCKETLGRIRGKFDGKLPTPVGDLSLDYENLLLESEREKCFLKYVIFKEKELLNCGGPSENVVLAFYINMGNLNPRDIEAHVESVKKKIRQKPGFTHFYIPIKDGETRVECVYPSGSGSNVNPELFNNLSQYLEGIIQESKKKNKDDKSEK